MTSFIEWLQGKDSDCMASYGHVRRMLLGDIMNINKLAILTAANPEAKKLSNRKNNELMKELGMRLRIRNYGPISVTGQYGHKEPSFVVPHMSKDEAISLGQDYDQESIIYAEKFIRDDGQKAMRFQLISCKDGSVISTRCKVIGNDIQDETDSFTKVKGRKFNIPFFDNSYESDCV